MKTCKIVFGVLMLWLSSFSICFADGSRSSLDLEGIKLADALQIMAKLMHINLIVSPSIKGEVSLHLHDSSMQQAFSLLLMSQGLAKWKIGQVWYVASQTEWINRTHDMNTLKSEQEESSPLAVTVLQIHYAKAEDIAKLIQDNTNSLLSKRGHVKVDPRTNILCIQDLPANNAQIYQLIKKLDVPVQQVLVETRLVSVDSDYEKQLGVNFSVNSQDASNKSEFANKSRYSLAVVTLSDGSLLDLALAAMENAGKGQLISSPSLFTANQQSASIESGEEIPYQEVSASGGTGVAFKKAVLSLKVTPQIMPDNKILLQLQVNQDRPSSRIVLGVPAISTRQMVTNILIKHGRTVVLGGIYELNQEQDEQRVPILGKIPVVGWLFKQQNIKANKRELLIFVTPKIIPA